MSDLKPGIALLAQMLADARPKPAACRRIAVTLGGRRAVLHFGPPDGARHAIRHDLGIGDDGHATLEMPQAALDWLIAPIANDSPHDPVQRGMLIELACLDLLAAIETELDAQVRPAPGERHSTGFAVRAETGDGDLHLALHLSNDLAGMLTEHLDRNAPAEAPPDPAEVSLRLTLSHGQQFLSDAEINMLAPGDVVMLEPGPAMLLAGDGFAAAVELGQDGARLSSDMLPLPDAPARPDRHVTFQSAQIDMTLAALNDLVPGDWLTLFVFGHAAVDIVIDGRIAGRGDPVTIGAGRGIRISRIFETAGAA